MQNHRISKDELYLNISYEIARRSRCSRLQVGCVIVRDKRIISSGCNGPLDSDGCEYNEKGRCQCDLKEGCKYSIHAEANAITFAAKTGVSVDEASLYCTDSPCRKCVELIVQAGIVRVIYDREYRDTLPLTYLTKNGVQVIKHTSGVR